MIDTYNGLTHLLLVVLFIALMAIAVATNKKVFALFAIVGAFIFELIDAVSWYGFSDGIIITLVFMIFWILLLIAVLIPTKNGVGFAAIVVKLLVIIIFGLNLVRELPYLLGAILIGVICLRKKHKKVKTSTSVHTEESVSGLVMKLEKLEACYEAGIITDEEFLAKKQQLMK